MSNATNYTNGRAFEYRIMAELSKAGYYCIRSSGSHGLVDIVGFKTGETLLVQCKGGFTGSPIGPDAWNRLYALAVGLGPSVLPVLVTRDRRGRLSWSRLAGACVPYARSRPSEPWSPDPLATPALSTHNGATT